MMSGSPLILVVDDEDLVRSTVAEVLEHAGYRVLEAPDAEQALQCLAERADISLLITDIRLPGKDGLELATLAQRGRPGLPVMAMSGYFAPRPVPWRLLRKPFGQAELIAAVREELAPAGSGPSVPGQ
jgi:CheY-like chemotaxis protein